MALIDKHVILERSPTLLLAFSLRRLRVSDQASAQGSRGCISPLHNVNKPSTSRSWTSSGAGPSTPRQSGPPS